MISKATAVFILILVTPAWAKLTFGTVTPVVAGVTTIAVNGKTLIDSIKHPKKAVGKIKKAVTGK